MNSDLIVTIGAIGFIFLLFNVIFLAVIFSAQKDAGGNDKVANHNGDHSDVHA